MKDELSELRHARALMTALLERISEAATCIACGAHICLVRNRQTNAIEAYDPDGASHNFKCPDAVYRRRIDMARAAAAHPAVRTE